MTEEWSNWETWRTDFWLENANVKPYILDEFGEGDSTCPECIANLASLISERIELHNNPLRYSKNTVYTDLLKHSFKQINYKEIAKRWLQERNNDDN